MKIMFVHQNMPGQYRELVQWLADTGEHQIYFLTQRQKPPSFKGVETRIYKTHHKPAKDAYGLSKNWEESAGNGLGAARAARRIEKTEGFKPDIVIGHVGWGELTFFKDVWPDVPIIGFFEYFYSDSGGPVGFDPEDPVTEDTAFLLRVRNAVPLANIETVDIGLSPTFWQRDRFPESFHDKLRDEFLNREIFYSLTEAAIMLEAWRKEYNSERIHNSLGYQTPDEYAANAQIPFRATPSTASVREHQANYKLNTLR